MTAWTPFALMVFWYAWEPVADWLSAAMLRRLSRRAWVAEHPEATA